MFRTLLNVIADCDNWPYTINFDTLDTKYRHYIFTLEDRQTAIGIILDPIVEHIKTYNLFLESNNRSHIFVVNDEKRIVSFIDKLDNSQKKSEAINEMLLHWKSKDQILALQGWRNEIYPAYYTVNQHNDTVAFTLERAGSFLFGIETFGVHINGYTIKDGKMKLWVARRAHNKPTWPNMLDNTCAGGITYGDSVWKTLIKECEEEGSIPKELSQKAISCGLVTYTTLTKYGVSPETQYIYDLELPSDFEPRPNDSEVGHFYLWDIEEVIERLHNGEFKPNCGLIVIDFLIRHGFININNEPNLAEIQSRCHRASPFIKF